MSYIIRLCRGLIDSLIHWMDGWIDRSLVGCFLILSQLSTTIPTHQRTKSDLFECGLEIKLGSPYPHPPVTLPSKSLAHPWMSGSSLRQLENGVSHRGSK